MYIPHVAFRLGVQLCLLRLMVSATVIPVSSQQNTTDTVRIQTLNGREPAAAPQVYKPETVNITVPIGVGLSLSISYLGLSIPASDVDEYLYYGTGNVRRFVLSGHGDDPLRNGRWAYGTVPDFQIIVGTYQGMNVTYSQLFAVVEGLRTFMLGGKVEQARNLVFDVEMEGKGKIGFGILWYEAAKRLGNANPSPSNTSSHLQLPSPASSNPPLAASDRVVIPVLIPGNSGHTWFSLVFNFFGYPIDPDHVRKAFVASTIRVTDHLLKSQDDQPIPDNRYEYDDSDVHIIMIGNRGVAITWTQLFFIQKSLYTFVSRRQPRYQMLHYEIHGGDDGQIGFGLLWENDPLPNVDGSTSTN